jgi:Gpi18-like mannosyltransferase
MSLLYDLKAARNKYPEESNNQNLPKTTIDAEPHPDLSFNLEEQSEIRSKIFPKNSYFTNLNTVEDLESVPLFEERTNISNKLFESSHSDLDYNLANEDPTLRSTIVLPITAIKSQYKVSETELANLTIKANPVGNYFGELGAFLKNIFCLENLIFGIVILLTLRIRFAFFPFQTNDYNSFLKPWMQYIVDHGGFEAFRVKFYDYTPFYVYLLWIGTELQANYLYWIKGISVLFDFVMAYYIGKIVAIKYPKVFKMAFLVTLMAPAVVFNGSLWGQVDVMYSSMVMACLYYILTNKHIKAALFFALGLCLKLQSLFFAPVFLWLIVTKNIPKKFIITLVALFVGLYLVMILPISQGVIFQNNPLDSTKNARPLFDSTFSIINGVKTETPDTRDGLLTIYPNQPKNYSHIVMGPASSMYQWVDDKNYEYFYQNGLTIAIVVVLILAYYLVSNKIVNVDNDVIIKLALISTLAVPFLLPKMHERYFFLADVMALVYAFWFPKKFWVGVAIAFISFTVYIQAVIGGNIPEIFQQQYNALWVMLILIYLIYDLIKGLRESYKIGDGVK